MSIGNKNSLRRSLGPALQWAKPRKSRAGHQNHIKISTHDSSLYDSEYDEVEYIQDQNAQPGLSGVKETQQSVEHEHSWDTPEKIQTNALSEQAIDHSPVSLTSLENNGDGTISSWDFYQSTSNSRADWHGGLSSEKFSVTSSGYENPTLQPHEVYLGIGLGHNLKGKFLSYIFPIGVFALIILATFLTLFF